MEEKKLVVIYSYSRDDAYILSLDKSQMKLLKFLSDKNIIDLVDFSWTDVVINAIEEV